MRLRENIELLSLSFFLDTFLFPSKELCVTSKGSVVFFCLYLIALLRAKI